MENKQKVLEGIVVSDSMNKTVVVKVARFKKHALYGKKFKVHKKFKAHDAKNEAKKGNFVKIIESKPYSKDKRFKLLEVLPGALR